MSKFLKIIVNLIVICAILVAAALLIPPFAGVNTVMNDNSSKETNLPTGSVAYGKTVDAEGLKKGDKVIYTANNQAYVYQITDMDTTAGTYKVKNVYDSNAEETSIQLINEAVKVVIVVPYIAYAAIALQSKEGLIVVGLGIIFLIILFILAELWRKDDEEDDEEEYDEDEEEYDEDEEDDDEDDDEEEELSWKERRRLKKEEKRRKKLEKKGMLQEDSEEEEEPEEAEAVAEPVMAEKEPDDYDDAMQDAMASIAQSIAQVQKQQEMQAEGSEGIRLPGEETEETEQQEVLISDVTQISAEPAPVKETSEEGQEEEIYVSQEEQEMSAVTGDTVAIPTIPEPMPEINKEAVLPAPSVTELLAKAEAAGETPELIEDKDNDVTLLDYTKLL